MSTYQHEETRDGLVVWKMFLDTYRYDGNVDVYISVQQEVLKTKFHAHYPGGALAFAEAYETAFINIDKVSPEPLYTDVGKRNLFLLNFSVTDHTADLADLLAHNTETWHELMDYLRSSLARRSAVAAREATQHAHIVQVPSEPPIASLITVPDCPPTISTENAVTDPAVVLFLNTARAKDYHVGKAL